MATKEYGYEIVDLDDRHVATVVYLDGKEPKTQQITGDHPSYRDVTDRVLSGDSAEIIRETFNVALALKRKLISLTERVAIRDDKLFFDGDELHGSLAEQIVRHYREGVDFGPLVAFLELLYSNPGKDENPEARENILDQSHRWIASARLDITEEGFIVGYKGVQKNSDEDAWPQYRSTRSGHAFVQDENGEITEIENDRIPQSVGDVVFMPRSEVAYDPSSACSTGLHVGTREYARTFGNTTVRVIVHPRDIVSVPTYSDQKMRVSRYVVDGEEDRELDSPSFPGPVYNSPYAADLYPSDEEDQTPAEAREAEEPVNPNQTEFDELNGEKGIRNRKTGRVWRITSKRAGILRLQDPATQERMTKPVAGISKSFVKLNW